MELLTITLAAGESKRFEKPGRYFEIIDSVAAVRVDFYSVSGQQTDQMQNALSGLFLECNYGAFTITSATAQTISFLLLENGRGGSRRQPGVVSVTNKISAATQATFGNGALTVGFTATQIVAPAANVRGLIVRRASTNVQGNAGGGGSIEGRIIAAPVIPVSTVPAQSFQICGTFAVGNSTGSGFVNDMNYQLPAGWGVWLVNSVAVAAAQVANYEMTFELVQ